MESLMLPLHEPLKMLVGGSWMRSSTTLEIRNPFDHKLVATVCTGSAADIRDAIRAAARSLESDFPAHQRYEVLMRAADRVEQRKEAHAMAIAREGSKTIREAQREPVRSAAILRLSADEGRRICGETLPFDTRPGSENRVGYWFRVPVGIVGAITPFNDPLAVAAHKVGPALAAGNAVVLKPASATPLSALLLAQDLVEAGLPPGRLSVIPGQAGELGQALITDPRVRLVTFTGGLAAGTWIAGQAGVKKLLLELGSNSPVIVLADADLERAVPAIAAGAFTQAGQNCLGVQRVLVHDGIYETFSKLFVEHVSKLRAGSSLDEATDVCAMINEREAARIENWIREAVAGGARVLAGGRREGTVVWPTVLEQVPDGVRLDSEEAYGPVVSLYRVSSLDDAILKANVVDCGLHAAIFTENLRNAFTAVRRLNFGAVIVNDSTDYRLDVMPFGGMKQSGIGREGIRFAVQEMTETRVVCLNL